MQAREDALFAVDHKKASCTQFFVRDLTGQPYSSVSDMRHEYRPVVRGYYKQLIHEHVSMGFPIRVHTLYAGGNPIKRLTLLPLPDGFLSRAEAA